MGDARNLAAGVVAEVDQSRVEEDRLDAPDPLPADLDVLLGRESLARLLRLPEHLGEARCVEMTLVEQLLCRLDDRGDDPRSADDATRCADGTVADPGRDVPDLERELGRPGQRIPAPIHRCRAGVRRLPRPGDSPALDSVRPEHGAEGDPHRLEDGPLLDVELEVCRGRGELRVRVERAVEVDAAALRARREARRRRCRSGGAARPGRASSPAAAEEPRSERPKRDPSSSAQLTSRTVTGGVPSSAIRRSTSAPATTLRLPSSQPPFATESMWPPIRTARSESPRSVHQSLPAASRSRSRGSPSSSPSSQARAVFHVSVQATRWAPFSSPVSSCSSRSWRDDTCGIESHRRRAYRAGNRIVDVDQPVTLASRPRRGGASAGGARSLGSLAREARLRPQRPAAVSRCARRISSPGAPTTTS